MQNMKMNIKLRGIKALLAPAFFAIIFACLFPIELYCNNRNEFLFGPIQFFPLVICVTLCVFTILTILGFLLREKIAKGYDALLFGIGILFYVQTNFLNIGMHQLNGQSVDWCADKRMLAINCLVWIVGLCISMVLAFYKNGRLSVILLILAAMVTAMQGASTITSVVTSEEPTDQTIQLTSDGMFDISKKDNIIMFVVDTLDASFFEEFIENDNENLDWLKDFTYFDNAVAGGGPTHYGMPLLLTGKYYDGKDYDEYKSKAYNECNLYKKLKQNNYHVGLYTEKEFVSEDFFKEYIDNISAAHVGLSDPGGMITKFYQFVAYRCFPNILKNKLYFYSGDFNSYNEVSFENGAKSYSINDSETIAQYRESGLSLTENEGAFKVYHLFGAHGPYTLKADGTTDGNETSLQEQIDGVIGFIREYIYEMKRLGVFDTSTIVITGDHGAKDVYQNPCILVKTANSQKQEALKTLHTPVTFENVLPTLSMAIDGKNDEMNNTLFEVQDNPSVVRYQIAEAGLVRQYFDDNSYRYTMKFSVGYDARDESKIKLVGPVKELQEYRLGDTIDFSEGGNGEDYLYTGFSGQEREGIWTDGNDATILLPLDEMPQENLSVEIQLNSVFNGKQYVSIFFNDICVYSTIQESNTISFVVPHTAVLEGDQKIRLRLSTARPIDILDSEDDRQLSINLKDMRLADTKKAATVVEAGEQFVHQTKTLDFSAIGNCEKYLFSGWHGQEEKHRWSSEKASIGVMWDSTKDCIMQITGWTYPPSGAVDVFFNGTQVATLQGDQFEPISLPAELADSSDLQTIEFVANNATSPEQAGENEDYRILGIAMNSIDFKMEG